jgi:K+-transporting ATPase ATPase A chain
MQLVVYLAILLLLAWPLGRAIESVAAGRFAWGRRVEAPLFRLAGIDAEQEQGWLSYTVGLLVFNGLGVLAVYALQRLQGGLSLNPQDMAAVSPDSAFNTAVSFVTNTNWQGYGGESSMSYLTQMLGLTVQNFLSAATGIVVVIALIRGFARHTAQGVGNVWVDLTRVTLWVLLPMSLVFALVLAGQGVIQNLKPYQPVQTLEAVTWQQPKLGSDGQPVKDDQGQAVMEAQISPTQTLAMGPVASQLAIKMIGTNGGGFFNANSAHPYENPTALTNFLQMLSIFLIPTALCFVLGRMVGDLRRCWRR